MSGAKSKSSMLRDFRQLTRLWPYLRSNQRLILIAIALVPVVSVFQAWMPHIIQQTIDDGMQTKDLTVVTRGAILFLIATLAAYAARAGQSVTSALAVHRMTRDLRISMVAHILRLNCAYHDRTLSGTLVTRATSDFDNLNESLNQGVLTSIVDIAVLVGCLVGLVLLDWRLALIAVFILPLVAVVVNWFSAGMKRTLLDSRVKISTLNAFTQECLYGSSTVKLLNAQPAAKHKFDRLNHEYRDAQMKSVVLDSMMFSVIDGIATITIGLILWGATSAIGISQYMTAGLLVAFITYIQQLFEPIKQLGNKIAMLQGAFTSIDRIFTVLDHHEFVAGNAQMQSMQGNLEFRNVSFAYRSVGVAQSSAVTSDPAAVTGAASAPILKDVSFSLRPGESLAIVGPTGSGKSTIVKLVTKLYDGYEGQILIDGQDIRTLDDNLLRQKIAIVPQDIVLFDGDLYFNIGLGHPGINREMVHAAAQAVGADEFIRHLPKGYETVLREQGSNLSHGQRQLIAFARALAKNPSMVVLDEATSSVDHQSELAIQRAIETILAGRTVIVVAHRLSTVRKCTSILVLKNGAVAEIGPHEQLLAAGGHYAELHRALYDGGNAAPPSAKYSL
jgi:ATP-binding cassette subfamily B protein